MARVTKELPRHTRRDRWIAIVTDLVDQIGKWAEAETWSVDRTEKRVHEEALGDYSVPALRIRAPGGEIHIDPVALNVVGADGRVDIEAWPTLNRVRLIREKGDWKIITDSNVPLRQKWSRPTFVQLVHDLHA